MPESTLAEGLPLTNLPSLMQGRSIQKENDDIGPVQDQGKRRGRGVSRGGYNKKIS